MASLPRRLRGRRDRIGAATGGTAKHIHMRALFAFRPCVAVWPQAPGGAWEPSPARLCMKARSAFK